MKKLFCIVLVLTLALAVPAQAQQDLTQHAIATATVQAARFVDVTAPYSGTLSSFDLVMGDSVSAGEVLMTMNTTGLYATEGGKVSAVFAVPGDDAAALSQRYGGIVAVEPDALYQLRCTTAGAYSESENKLLHLGEKLYFKSTKNKNEKGEGRVVSVSGSNYVVDVLSGEFEMDESLSLYRDDDYANRDCVGKGVVTRRSDALHAANGRVAEVLVQEGETVQAGQLLATLMSMDAEPDASPTVVAPADGVVSSVQAVPGQQVWKGQVLCRIELTASIEAVADVDEMDLGSLAVGDKVAVTIDMNGESIITGTVSEISCLGITKQNAAYYTVRVAIPAGSAPLGASASVYLPRE